MGLIHLDCLIGSFVLLRDDACSLLAFLLIPEFANIQAIFGRRRIHYVVIHP